jgi:hypothetical protein
MDKPKSLFLTWLTIRDSEWMQVADLRFCAATCRKVCTKSGPRSALSGALGGRVASSARAFPDQRNSSDYETDWCTPQFKWCDRPPDPQLQARSPSPPCACDDLGRFTTGVNTKLSPVGVGESSWSTAGPIVNGQAKVPVLWPEASGSGGGGELTRGFWSGAVTSACVGVPHRLESPLVETGSGSCSAPAGPARLWGSGAGGQDSAPRRHGTRRHATARPMAANNVCSPWQAPNPSRTSPAPSRSGWCRGGGLTRYASASSPSRTLLHDAVGCRVADVAEGPGRNL